MTGWVKKSQGDDKGTTRDDRIGGRRWYGQNNQKGSKKEKNNGTNRG